MAPKRFRFSLRALLVATLLVALCFGYLIASRDAVVNRSNYNRIQLGMCESAVDELFQQPPMDVIPLDYDDVAFEESHNAKTVKCWKGERYLITVAFDKHGRVAGKYYERAPNPSIVDRLADWLGF